jgi:hypothetical protein
MKANGVVFGVNFDVFQHKNLLHEVIDVVGRVNDLTRDLLA